MIIRRFSHDMDHNDLGKLLILIFSTMQEIPGIKIVGEISLPACACTSTGCGQIWDQDPKRYFGLR